VDYGTHEYSQNVNKELSNENLGLSLVSLDLSKSATETITAEDKNNYISLIKEAGIIISPWEIVIADHAIAPELASAVVSSPAVKLLVPTRSKGWEWAGVDQWNTDFYVRQTVNAVKQIIENKCVKPIRPLGVGAIIGIVIGAIFLLLLLGEIFAFFGGLF
jgi:hypothetical protein